ncbi:MAG TPA: Hsp70 family protein [Polyangiaceae bacterium]|nr:Hsp70 family protein [Polyangiaceae bacterium]
MSVLPPTAYAIDFGTTNSLIAAANAERVWAPLCVDTHASDPTVLRSVLFFSDDKAGFECGGAALRACVESGMRGRLIRSIKRFLPVESFRETRIGTRRYSLEELVAILIRHLRERANALLGVDIRTAVLGCPARFSDEPAAHELARRRLLRAAELAGFERVALCEEPVAAALDRAHSSAQSELIAVADLGGGTSDFTVARVGDGRAEVLAVGGVATAGDALDGALMRRCIAPHFGSRVTYRAPFGENVLTFPRPLLEKLCSPAELSLLDRHEVLTFVREMKSASLREGDRELLERLLCLIEDRLGFQLFEAIDETKRRLSLDASAPFRFDYPSIELHQEIERSEFESATELPVERILDRLDETLQKAGVQPQDIDGVYCTGGTARVPVLVEGITRRFGTDKVRHVSTFHAVIKGLAERARSLLGEAPGQGGSWS